MSAKSSLFAKIRDAALALGRSERTAKRKARLLSSASFSEFTRLTPERNVKLGLSPKARHYVLKLSLIHIYRVASDLFEAETQTTRQNNTVRSSHKARNHIHDHPKLSHNYCESVSVGYRRYILSRQPRVVQGSPECVRVGRLCLS